MRRLAARIALIRWSIIEERDAERGATATEYAILVGFIVIVIVGGITFFGAALGNWYNQLASQLGL